MTEIQNLEVSTEISSTADLLNPEIQKITDYQEPEDIKRFLFILKHAQSLQKENARILDVGCGNGHVSRGLARLGFKVSGIDIDPSSIECAKTEVGSIADFMVLDTADLGNKFKEEEFDLIICSEVLEHLTDPKLMVQQLYPFLSKDGVMVVTTPNGFGPRESTVTKPVQKLYKMGFGSLIGFTKRMLGYKGATAQSSNPDLTHIQFFTQQALEETVALGGKMELVEFGHANYVEKAFPQSIWIKGDMEKKAADCLQADKMPSSKVSGWNTAWKKSL